MSDAFLNGRVCARQPEAGFRSGLDAVMLAAAVPARAGHAALELGAGAGIASLCLAARVAGVAVTGIEIAPDLARLANANAAANALADRVTFAAADLFDLPPDHRRGYDCVFANPPFHGAGLSSPDADRARALQDGGRLGAWLRMGVKRTVSGGSFTAILRANRLGEALGALPETGVTLLPLWPKAGLAAKRVIVQLVKGAGAPFALLPGLVLHQPDGRYTPEADDILRDGGALALNSTRL